MIKKWKLKLKKKTPKINQERKYPYIKKEKKRKKKQLSYETNYYKQYVQRMDIE